MEAVMEKESATFVCSHVFANTSPVLLVARENGDWMHLCGQLHQGDEEYRVVGVEHLFDRDPSLREVMDLADNTEAERAAVGMPWVRRALAPHENE
jgi:hypothetical protein